ncbi:phosphatase PAP2 family protein [Aquimarina sp. 2201CG14-23]|uniref:phosphatase PAP2 family protein n=1 Tax=Aquimarina mycalae TaxID=3040073 RepID=UPI002478147D|nr:phosphatase PAP2 family protein [Aquimarina sp. 2201CG14-23]MDH7444340.1 phosphatase PAP2 family protein [Aquimarina sp. 2201CG14-23]
MRISISLLLICLCIYSTQAQFTDSPLTKTQLKTSKKTENKKPKKNLFTKRIVPITLIASGLLLSTSDFEKSLQKDIRGSVGDDFYFGIDDYTRYAPIVQMYAADIFGVESKNHWFDQTKNLLISSLITSAATTILKQEVRKERPEDPTKLNSFPSGHTSMAFVSAAVLYEEFIDTSPLLAYSGYFFAITTGSLRMMNNKHYLSDVLVGAGIGILSTRLVYHFDHLISWNPFKEMDDVAFAPQFTGDGLALYFSKSF